ncbi:MAG: hypothetical protein AABZ54_00640 [Bacteroidota bacterium]
MLVKVLHVPHWIKGEHEFSQLSEPSSLLMNELVEYKLIFSLQQEL